MSLSPEFLLHIAQAIGLGLGVAFALWLLRGYAATRRVQVSVLLAAVLAGIYLILKDSGLPGETVLIKIVVAGGVLLGANAVLQLLDLVVWDYFLRRRRHVIVPRLLVDLFHFLALTAVALVVLNAVFGVALDALLVTSTVLSAVIGLALQDILSNIIAGVALQIERPFSVGDWVEVAGQEGQVVQMNWRTLTLRTRDHHNIFLPNANAGRQDIINFSRPTSLQRLHASVGVAYGHPPALVSEVLTQAAAGVEGVLADPLPEALVVNYGDFSIGYDLRFWITDFAGMEQIHGAVMARVWYALRRAGMTIPFPIRDVNLRTISEDHEAKVRARIQRDVFATLRPLPVFEPLTDAQIEQLVSGAFLRRYTTGEALVTQGEAGASLFVIRSGQVVITSQDERGRKTKLATMGPGEFFGEMSLLTGEPRSATVTARSETEVVVVDKADFAEVLTADTGLLGGLSAALDARMRHMTKRLAAEADRTLGRPAPSGEAALLARIGRFFGIKT